MLLKMNGQRMYEVTSDFLQKESFRSHPHSGIDLRMGVGTDLYSPVHGIVKKVVDYGNENIGKGVFIETQDHQTVILGHLSSIEVKKGAVLQIGDKIGLSGNTGNVVGNGHLHIGLKDASGHIINPIKIEGAFQEVAKNHVVHKGVIGSTVGAYTDFMSYIHDLKTEGFFMATFDKTPSEFFFGWLEDGLKGALHFILENDEGFFILPAMAIMFLTFLIGKNKYTKWTLPLWLAYFASSILTQTTGLMDWLAK